TMLDSTRIATIMSREASSTDARVIYQEFQEYRTSFVPSSVSNMLIWFKGDQVSGNTGDAIGTWEDQSGNGSNATKGTAGSKPTLQKNQLGPYAVLRFDGTNDSLSLGDLAALN